MKSKSNLTEAYITISAMCYIQLLLAGLLCIATFQYKKRAMGNEFSVEVHCYFGNEKICSTLLVSLTSMVRMHIHIYVLSFL